MKFICSADWHIRASNPRIRTDDYTNVQLNKIAMILDIAKENDANVIVAGDVFDGPRCPFSLLNRYMDLFSDYKNLGVTIFAVAGQHDLHFHNPDLDNTPLGTFVKSGLITIPRTERIFGVGWGEKIEDAFGSKVLIHHFPVCPDKPPFFMDDAISAEDMLNKIKKTGCELMVTGDYHYGHYISDFRRNCTLINPGPIMRASKDKMDYVPKVYLYSSEGRLPTIKEINIPVEKDCFDFDIIDNDTKKELSDELKELVGAFSAGKESQKFWDVVDLVLKSAKCHPEVKEIIMEIKEGQNG
jgi:DNA repair exonuclease SbcCD nuclease subunit